MANRLNLSFRLLLIPCLVSVAPVSYADSHVSLSNLSLDTVNLNAVSINIAVEADPISLDPHEQLSETGVQYAHLVFDPLVRMRQDGSFEPRLASSWEMLSQTRMRLHLRRDVVFHSGNIMTAEDVVFSLKRLQQSVDFKGLFTHFSSIEKVDDFTIDIATRHPYPLLLNLLAYAFVLDKAYYEASPDVVKFAATFASGHVSGSGPYTVIKRQVGQELALARFTHYWDTASEGNVERIHFLPIRSDSTRLAALLTGGVDMASPIAPIDVERVQRNEKLSLIHLPGTRIVMLQLNQTRHQALANEKVRRAINLAINQTLIVDKILRGLGQAAGQLSAPAFLGHIDELKPEYDLKQAKALMVEAGYEEGIRLTMMAPNNRYMADEQVAQAVVGMLAKIGIQIELKTFPKAQYFQLYDQRAADVMMLGWQSDTFDSNNIYEFVIACEDRSSGRGAYNGSQYCQRVVDQDIELANQEVNPERRIRALQRIERQVWQDSVVVPLYWQPILWAGDKRIPMESVVNFLNFPYWGDLNVPNVNDRNAH